jgi:hypothetical protein
MTANDINTTLGFYLLQLCCFNAPQLEIVVPRLVSRVNRLREDGRAVKALCLGYPCSKSAVRKSEGQ